MHDTTIERNVYTISLCLSLSLDWKRTKCWGLLKLICNLTTSAIAITGTGVFAAGRYFSIWILMHECFFIILNPGIFSLFPCLFLFFLCFYSINGIILLYVKQIMSRIWDITYMKIISLYSQQETNVLDKEILPKFSD